MKNIFHFSWQSQYLYISLHNNHNNKVILTTKQTNSMKRFTDIKSIMACSKWNDEHDIAVSRGHSTE
jgi:hypothetical protein